MMSPKPFRLLLALLSLIGAEHVMAANVSPSMLKIERFSAERGDAQSQYFLGEHYELGDSGVERDLDMALFWYRKAAEQGHGVAQFKIGLFHDRGYAGLKGGRATAVQWYTKAAASGSDAAKAQLDEIRQAEDEAESARLRERQQAAEQERRRQLKRQRERAEMLSVSKPAMAALPLKIPKKKQEKPKEYPPGQTIEKLLSTSWSDSGKPAEYLPAEDMSCLKTGEQEITCFSRARERVVKNSRLSFSVKSVISEFERDGSFVIQYFYNVSDIDKVGGKGPNVDSYGLKVTRGWQEPGLTANCIIEGKNSVQCTGRNEMTVSFVSK